MDWSDEATTAIKLSGMGDLTCLGVGVMLSFQSFNLSVIWSYMTSCAMSLDGGHGNLQLGHNTD